MLTSSGTVKARVRAGRVVSSLRRPSAGRASSSGAPRSCSVQAARCGYSSWGRSCPTCWNRAWSANWTARGRRADRVPPVRAPYAEARSRTIGASEAPSVAMWCTASVKRQRWAPVLTRPARSGIREERSKPAAVSTASWRRMPEGGSWMRCTGRPSISGKVVRRTSWRATRSSTAPASAVVSRSPSRSASRTTVYSAEPGARRWRNHSRAWSGERGSSSCGERGFCTTQSRRRIGAGCPSSPGAL